MSDMVLTRIAGATVYREHGRTFARLQAMAIDDDRLDGLPETLRPSVSRWFERLEEMHGSQSLGADVEEPVAARHRRE